VPHRTRQSDCLLELLATHAPSWVSLAQVLDLHIAQYNARVLELRRAGFTIENRTEFVDGRRLSWFRLVQQNGAAPTRFQAAPSLLADQTPLLFQDLAENTAPGSPS
jgi:hypothetical protein